MKDDDGSGPLTMPVRAVAAVLGLFFVVGGVLIFATGVSELPGLWIPVLEGVVGVLLGGLFLVAAKTGRSPAWPD